MPGKAVKVTIATAVLHAVLPDGRKAVSNGVYNLSFADFSRISPSARETMFSSVEIVPSAASAFNGTDLTIDSVGIPQYHVLGEIIEGTTEGDLYKLVQVVGQSASVGSVMCWTTDSFNSALVRVTQDRVGGSGKSPLVFAGVALVAITVNRYGYIQIAGEVPAIRTPGATTAAGTTLKIHATTDGGTAAETNAKDALFTTTATAVSSSAPAFIAQSSQKQKRRLKNKRNWVI